MYSLYKNEYRVFKPVEIIIRRKIKRWTKYLLKQLQEWGEEADKGECWRGWIQVWYIVRTFVKATCTPSEQQKNYSSMTNWLFKSVMFYLHGFELFLKFSLTFISNFIPLWTVWIWGIILFIVCTWDLLYDLGYDLFWRKFSGLLRKMCSMLL
jgi:hypothetical protein